MEHIFKNLQQAIQLQEKINRFEEGEIIYCKEEDCYYKFTNNNFEKTEFKGKTDTTSFESQMTLFEINQSIIRQLPNLTQEELGVKQQEINKFHTEHKSNYYMLLCKEISYFTMFEFTTKEGDFSSLGKATIECLLEGVGPIVSIDVLDNEVEIWVRDDKEEVNCFHLFDYALGVVFIER